MSNSFYDERFDVPQTDEDLNDDFDSTDLHECLDYAKENNDFETLEKAIAYHCKNVRDAKEEIILLRDTAHASGKLDFYEKKANKILNILKK